MALTAALGALAGAAGNTTAARTSTSSSTSTPTYSADQSGLQSTVASTLQDRLKNGVDLTPLRTAGTDQINKSYAGVGDRLTSALAARGFGSSGTVGTGLRSVELAKAGDEGSLENRLENYSLGEQDKTLGLATGFGFENPGHDTSGTNVGAGSSLAGGLGAAFNSLTGFQNALMQMMSKGATA